MKKPQSQIVVEKLLKDGEISRNWCLQHYVSRLSAIIKSLVEVGYKFDSRKSKKGDDTRHGHYVKTKKGKDYVYTLIAVPKNVKGMAR